MTTEPTTVGGRYEIGEVLGRGGMAEVHVGRDIRLGRRVAVKMLRADLARDPTFQARFRREAQSAAALNHPAIVAVYDTGEDVVDGTSFPYIVMEHVEGSTLRDLLNSGRRLLPERALEISSGVLDALDYSHRHGIVHRDIKPANVMLTRAGDVKVMDFGIARAVADTSATMTQTSAVIGTAQYLSPEQARGEQVDARSDLYSAGCLLYELLTGRPPFIGDSPVAVAYQHVREEPQPPSTVDPEVPAAIDAIVLKSLTKDREQRYQTAAEMRADIDRALAGRPVEAPAPAPTTQRLAPVAAPVAASTFPVAPDDDEPRRRPWTYVLLGFAVVAVFLLALLFGSRLFGGTTQAVVPDVVGLTEEAARAELLADGFVVGDVTSEPNDDVDEGLVLRQDPDADDEVDEGATIALVLSGGEETTVVPTLVGLPFDEASDALEDAGLTLGDRTTTDSAEPANQVLSADPGTGADVPAGSAVDLEVASGSNEVPDVEGDSEGEARSALSNAGFSVTSRELETADADPGEVVDQTPDGGSTLRIDSEVTIVVASAPPEPPPTPTPTPEPEPEPEPEPTEEVPEPEPEPDPTEEEPEPEPTVPGDGEG